MSFPHNPICSSLREEEVETMELLDEYWYFESLFQRRTRMFRSSSYPYPSSNEIEEVVMDKRIAGTLSSPINLPKKEDSTICRSLQRAPSLPPCIGRGEVIREKENDRKLSKLTRQTSLSSSSDVSSPLRASKTISPSPGIPRHRARKELKAESLNKDNKNNHPCLTKEVLYRSLSYNKSSKSLSDLESEEVQGFKDLGFTFNEEDLNPNVINIVPGLQRQKTFNNVEEQMKRPYLSEAWLLQRYAQSIPDNWIDHDQRSDGGDVKTQLKFWARMVASNVRQEC
ncbi:hypothetical protein GIB67_015618 [Kingdonia uniflora]|uniref:Uncharacterized protein n=1 Tax=Kingdonia uniflora TaxID=39325 RepID=A0A7J7NTZ1_9MAGN|nr:hypothetical protein GIB67_015618 [Kingdonia uniflora]